jgi:hypothetical protein
MTQATWSPRLGETGHEAGRTPEERTMSRRVNRIGTGLAAIAVAAAGSVLVAPAATAAQSDQPLTCDGQDIVVRTADNNSSDHGGWSAARIVEGGSGTLIPTFFAGEAYDVTTDQSIFEFSQVSGGGHGHNQQATITCTQVTTGTLGAMLEPGDELPPGTALDDTVTFTLTVTAVRQP